MRSYCEDFALTPGQVWLNAASEGPLPKVSAAALQEALHWKLSPERLTIPKFQQIPLELKKAIGNLVHAPHDQIILGNSTTYALHLLANGIKFQAADEIILMANDFPSDILPWLHLQKKGIVVRQLRGRQEVLTVAEIEQAINKRTRLLCLPYIHSFSGWPLDVAAIGRLCRRHGILFIVNAAQAVGAFEVNIGDLPIDALVCAGYKWLLGPYSTGFCWIKPELCESLEYPQAYWTAMLDERDLNSTEELSLKSDRSCRRYDVFATANFFNFYPWKASIEYLMGLGIAQVHEHNRHLVNQTLDGLYKAGMNVASPTMEQQRTSIVVFSHKEAGRNASIYEYLKVQGVHLALWKNKLRVSPHIYNTQQDIARFLEVLGNYDVQ